MDAKHPGFRRVQKAQHLVLLVKPSGGHRFRLGAFNQCPQILGARVIFGDGLAIGQKSGICG
jgi:hypothetical protein